MKCVLACQRASKLEKPHRHQECSFQPSEVCQKIKAEGGKGLTSANFALLQWALRGQNEESIPKSKLPPRRRGE